MSLTVDPRIGSGELLPDLQALGLTAELAHLDFGDIQCIGRGPEERPVLIGVERKTIGDLLRCISDKRFVGHQLPGLLASYEIIYLLVEGVITAGRKKELLILKDRGRWDFEAPSWGERTWKYASVMGWLMTLENRAGVRVIWSPDRRSTALWLAELETWWQQPWESHRSHLGMHHKTLVGSDNPLEDFEVTRKMKVAAAMMNGIGFEKAKAASDHFPSVESMLLAKEKDWLAVPGWGKKLARDFVNAVKEVVQ